MGQCCCKVKTVDPQVYADLVTAVNAYRGAVRGTAALVDQDGELLALQKDVSCGEAAPLLVSLVPAVLRASALLALAFGTTTSVVSTVVRGADWVCLVSRLPQSLATVILFAEGAIIDREPQLQQQQLDAIDLCTAALERDIALATAAQRARL